MLEASYDRRMSVIGVTSAAKMEVSETRRTMLVNLTTTTRKPLCTCVSHLRHRLCQLMSGVSMNEEREQRA